MTSNLQRLLQGSQLRNNSASGIALGIALLGFFFSASAQAAGPTFVVNSHSDPIANNTARNTVCETALGNNVCSLRRAIIAANHTPGGGATIILPALPPNSFYTLEIPASSNDENTGDLNITNSMDIIGGGAASTIIDGNGSVTKGRVFIITAGTVNISGVTVRNGIGTGDLSVGGAPFFFPGGGIHNSGTLTLTNVTVSGNRVSVIGIGGGISNTGTLTLINSTVSGNHVDGDGGGIRSLNSGTTLTLINSTVSGNSSTDSGGGISNNAILTVTNSTISGNTAVFGGGISNTGTLTLTNSTVSGNNSTGSGGGINNGGAAGLFNTTITNNQADAHFDGTGTGGGVFNSGGSFTFQNTIIAENSETVFLPRFNLRVATEGDCAGTITSNGNNLLGIVNCTVIGSLLPIADPKLGPLQNNGGPTQTHGLLAGSPAIDAGDPLGCQDNLGALLMTDQRGFPRPAVGCDIGAYELLTGSTSVVAALLPSSRSVQVNTPATAFATIINTGQEVAAACSIAPLTSVAASFQYQTTNPATNQISGSPNTPVNIAAGAAQSFVFAMTPNAPIGPTDVQFSFDCANSDPAPINTGLNTLLLSAAATPVPDIVVLAATPLPDPGIVNIPGTNGTGAFAVATVDVGATGNITASADTGSTSLPVNIFLCQTNPANGQCISGIGPTVTTTINANATPTFGIFVQGNGNVPFDPAVNRIFVRFKDGGNVTRGSTSVAVRTQ